MIQPLARWPSSILVLATMENWRWLVGTPLNRLPAIRAAFVLLLGILAFATPGFLSKPSILSLLTTVSFVGCVAIGMTLITISGNIMSFCLGRSWALPR